MNHITPSEMNELNTWLPSMDGYMPSLHVCPVCGGQAYGTTRGAVSMVCYTCGATWTSKRVIIKYCKYDPNNRYWDKRVAAYDSGWVEITALNWSGK